MYPNYAVKCYFNVYQKLEECFETPDGVLHPTITEAERWVETHANKKIITHTRMVSANKTMQNNSIEESEGDDVGDDKKKTKN